MHTVQRNRVDLALERQYRPLDIQGAGRFAFEITPLITTALGGSQPIEGVDLIPVLEGLADLADDTDITLIRVRVTNIDGFSIRGDQLGGVDIPRPIEH